MKPSDRRRRGVRKPANGAWRDKLAIPANRNLIVEKCIEDGQPLSRQAVLQWLDKGVPPARVITVARVLGVKPHEIRPDVFPEPARKAV
jgi:hypothetical protein